MPNAMRLMCRSLLSSCGRPSSMNRHSRRNLAFFSAKDCEVAQMFPPIKFVQLLPYGADLDAFDERRERAEHRLRGFAVFRHAARKRVDARAFMGEIRLRGHYRGQLILCATQISDALAKHHEVEKVPLLTAEEQGFVLLPESSFFLPYALEGKEQKFKDENVRAGALLAFDHVTRAIGDGDWSELKDVVTDSKLIDQLENCVNSLTSTQRRLFQTDSNDLCFFPLFPTAERTLKDIAGSANFPIAGKTAEIEKAKIVDYKKRLDGKERCTVLLAAVYKRKEFHTPMVQTVVEPKLYGFEVPRFLFATFTFERCDRKEWMVDKLNYAAIP